MRCRYCEEQAAWWRRCCVDCRQLERLFNTHRATDMGRMLDVLVASGVARSKVEKFLDADPRGQGSIRDQIAAEMTNQLLGALGQEARQTPSDVKRIRKRGGWRNLDQRPRE